MPFTFYVNRYRVTADATMITYTPAAAGEIAGAGPAADRRRALFDERADTVTKIEDSAPQKHRVTRRPVNA